MLAQFCALENSRRRNLTEETMSNPSCPLPAPDGHRDFSIIQEMLRAHRIAIVGASNMPGRASYEIANYLLDVGKEVIPVNPNHSSVLGLKCFASLEEVPGKIELVNVFRRPEFCADVVRSAIKVGGKAVWLQSGIRNEEARNLAIQAGLGFIQDRCLMVEHMHAER
jgi:predicted CoA-binding protein